MLIVAFVYTKWHWEKFHGNSAPSAADAAQWTFNLFEFGEAGAGWQQTGLRRDLAERLVAWKSAAPGREVWLSFGGDGWASGESSVWNVWGAQGEAFVETVAANLAAFLRASNVPFDGVDIDYEDTNAIRTDFPFPYNGQDLMVWLGAALHRHGVRISYTPQSPHLTETTYGGFLPIITRLSQLRVPNKLLIQFYNNPDFAVCSSAMDKASAVTANKWTIERVLDDLTAGGLTVTTHGVTYTSLPIDPATIVVLKPAAPGDAGSGYEPPDRIAGCLGNPALYHGVGFWRATPGREATLKAHFDAVCQAH